MSPRLRLTLSLLLALPWLAAGRAAAASKTLAAGETLTLAEDLVLAGADTLEIAGTAEKHCAVAGKGFRIATQEKWSGRLKITYCDFAGLGSDKLKL